MAQWVKALRYKPGGRGFDSRLVSLEFFIDIILPASLWPLGSTEPLTKNEYQEYFLGSKGSRCIGLTLPPSCADCLEIWEPQPPGTLRACPGM